MCKATEPVEWIAILPASPFALQAQHKMCWATWFGDARDVFALQTQLGVAFVCEDAMEASKTNPTPASHCEVTTLQGETGPGEMPPSFLLHLQTVHSTFGCRSSKLSLAPNAATAGMDKLIGAVMANQSKMFELALGGGRDHGPSQLAFENEQALPMCLRAARAGQPMLQMLQPRRQFQRAVTWEELPGGNADSQQASGELQMSGSPLPLPPAPSHSPAAASPLLAAATPPPPNALSDVAAMLDMLGARKAAKKQAEPKVDAKKAGSGTSTVTPQKKKARVEEAGSAADGAADASTVKSAKVSEPAKKAAGRDTKDTGEQSARGKTMSKKEHKAAGKDGAKATGSGKGEGRGEGDGKTYEFGCSKCRWGKGCARCKDPNFKGLKYSVFA